MTNKELSFLLKNISILYLEDEDDVREEMEKVLSLITDTIFVAKTGYEALDIFREHQPKIIISDISMPNFNGLEFIKEVRQTDFKTPIILLTAFTDTQYLLPAANLSIQSYLVKPISSLKLKESLCSAVRLINETSFIYVELPNNLKYNSLNSEFICDDGSKINLNKKEKRLIDLLISNKDRVVTYTEIENHVWSDYYEVMTSMALRTIIKNLRKKTSTSFIENISGQGYKVSIN